MNGRSLILNDGTVLEGSQCGYADHTLWCYISGLTMAEVFAVFSDPSKTQKIIFQYGLTKDTYEGFTEMKSISKQEYTIDVCMTKGEVTV